jgi:hypothetical protein
MAPEAGVSGSDRCDGEYRWAAQVVRILGGGRGGNQVRSALMSDLLDPTEVMPLEGHLLVGVKAKPLVQPPYRLILQVPKAVPILGASQGMEWKMVLSPSQHHPGSGVEFVLAQDGTVHDPRRYRRRNVYRR